MRCNACPPAEGVDARQGTPLTPRMRWMFCLWIGLVLSGCGKKDKIIDPADAGRAPALPDQPAQPKPTKAPKAARSPKPALRERPRTGPIIQASDAAFGRVLVVNSNLRFAVIDFGLRRLPDNGTRMSVYRDNLKVGEIKITDWRQESNAVGDITAGDLRTGDEVRPD